MSRDFIRNHCWLANNTGKRDDFLPFDQAQEHNNLDIKVSICESFPKQAVHSGVQVNHHSEGLSIDWEYLKKLHPAIHVIHAVASHLEQEFLTLMRAKKHTTPKKELDIKTLQESYHKA